MAPRAQVVASAAADLVLVAVFVLIGRASHREDQSGFLVTLWPFAAGLVVGWAAGRVRRDPLAPLRAGLPVWIAAVAVGMALRALSGQGVQVSFVIVASIVLGVFLVGWRGLAALALRRRRRAVPVR